MKTKRKILALLLTVTIVAVATLGLSGCNVEVTNPVNNADFIKTVNTVIWKENARYYDDFLRNSPNYSIGELTSGTPKSRLSNLVFEIAAGKYDGSEFYVVKFDIVADRDVEIVLDLYYGQSVENNKRHSAAISLKANVVSHQEWNLDKNFTVYNGDKSPRIVFIFENMPLSNTDAFAAWSQTEYQISHLEFYAETAK